jgi:GxxExxY protein
MIPNKTNKTNIVYPELSYQIMGAIFEVHKELGPGFVESAYEKALIEEFNKRRLHFEIQKPIGIDRCKTRALGIFPVCITRSLVETSSLLEMRALKRKAFSTLSNYI